MLLIITFTSLYLFFMAGLIVLARSRSSRLRELVRQKFFCARYGRQALARADKMLHATQLGLFLSAVGVGLSFAVTYMPYHGPKVESANNLDLFLFSLFFLIYLLLVLPALHAVRVVALARPNRTLCVLSVPLIYATKVIQPFGGIFTFIARYIARWFGSLPLSEREHFASPDEIAEIVDKSAKAGEVEEDERQMIKHVFTFRDTVVREVMTPRNDIVSVRQDVSLPELTATFVGERLSRVLVVGDTLDEVKGVILARDLVPFAGKIAVDFDIEKIIRPAYFVPGTKNVDQLLEEFKNESRHFAVVVDEHGGVDGVVTLEDLVEEIVGEIFDEYDNPLDESQTIRTRGGDTLVDAGMNIHDFNSSQKVKLPEGAYDTVAGFLIQQIGRLPQIGEEIEWEGSILKVEDIEDNRITRIRVTDKPRLNSSLAA